MTLQLSKYVVSAQAEVIATLLRKDGALRLYSGEQPAIETRTEGRLVSMPVSEVLVDGAMLTIKYESAVATKEGTASYFRLVSGNIPVLSDTLPDAMISDREIKVGTVIDKGVLVHTVFKQV